MYLLDTKKGGSVSNLGDIINQIYSSHDYYLILLNIRLKLIPLKESLSGFIDQ